MKCIRKNKPKSRFKSKKNNTRCEGCKNHCYYPRKASNDFLCPPKPILYDDYDSSKKSRHTKRKLKDIYEPPEEYRTNEARTNILMEKPMKSIYNPHKEFMKNHLNDTEKYKKAIYKKYIDNLGTEDPKTFKNSKRFGFEDIRKECLKRAGYKSELSGSTYGKIIIHHINSWDTHPDERYDLNNLIALTENEHKLFHSIYGYGKNTRKQWEEFIEDY